MSIKTWVSVLVSSSIFTSPNGNSTVSPTSALLSNFDDVFVNSPIRTTSTPQSSSTAGSGEGKIGSGGGGGWGGSEGQMNIRNQFIANTFIHHPPLHQYLLLLHHLKEKAIMIQYITSHYAWLVRIKLFTDNWERKSFTNIFTSAYKCTFLYPPPFIYEARWAYNLWSQSDCRIFDDIVVELR